MIGGGPFGFAPGEWTDDTSMAVAVARVAAQGTDLRTTAGLDAVATGLRAVVRLRAQGHRQPDPGGAVPSGLHRSRMQATAAHQWPHRWQRVADAHRGRRDRLPRRRRAGVEAALAVSALTHDDDRADQACQLWSHAIRHAVLHGTFDGVRGFLDGARARSPVLEAVDRSGRNRRARRTFRRTGGWCMPCRRPGGPSPTPTRRTPATCQAALELAVRAGHDTDTTAAIAGALLGARWGASAVPARWRRILHGWPGLRSRDLIVLGRPHRNRR